MENLKKKKKEATHLVSSRIHRYTLHTVRYGHDHDQALQQICPEILSHPNSA